MISNDNDSVIWIKISSEIRNICLLHVSSHDLVSFWHLKGLLPKYPAERVRPSARLSYKCM